MYLEFKLKIENEKILFAFVCVSVLVVTILRGGGGWGPSHVSQYRTNHSSPSVLPSYRAAAAVFHGLLRVHYPTIR